MAATSGAVASGHDRVSEAAATLLRGGGNAFDAAVAAGFAASAAEPMFTSLGGGGFLLARTVAGREVLYDFFADTPGRGAGAFEPHFIPMTVRFPAQDQVFNIGLGSAAVPGTLAGLLHVQRALGRAELEDVLDPAVHLAREGVVLNEHQAYTLGLLEPINTLNDRAAALYAPAGRTPGVGERLRNPDLAGFLERLPAEGAGALYAGAAACSVEEEMRDGGGLLRAADFAAYHVIERAPLAFARGGRRILTNPPPALGGELLAFALALLEALPLPQWDAEERVVQLVAAMQEVERRRESGEALDVTDAAKRVRRATGGTTHISVVDAEGNAASLSLSNGEGSGYVVPGTGIQLNNMLGEDDLHPDGFHSAPPGERIASMMAPTLVLEGHVPRLALGSGGSKRIRSAILQVLVAALDHGRSLAESVEAPRAHWDGVCVQLEPGFGAAAETALARRYPANVWPERNLYFGGVHVVARADEAAADPRRQGGSIVIR
jgi:gamma-glutamyltranspeptidase/glutathione hydrolase